MSACEWNDQAIAVGAGEGLANQGLVEQNIDSKTTVQIGKNGIEAIENGLLESRLWSWICESKEATMSSLSQNFERSEAGPGIGLLKKLGVSIQGGALVAQDPDAVEKEIKQDQNSFHPCLRISKIVTPEWLIA